MKFWKSVVGKLWATILSLVLIVLFILTVLLLEFIENYHVEEAENDLTQLANKVAVILEKHEDQALARSITWELADNLTSIAIIQDEKNTGIRRTIKIGSHLSRLSKYSGTRIYIRLWTTIKKSVNARA